MRAIHSSIKHKKIFTKNHNQIRQVDLLLSFLILYLNIHFLFSFFHFIHSFSPFSLSFFPLCSNQDFTIFLILTKENIAQTRILLHFTLLFISTFLILLKIKFKLILISFKQCCFIYTESRGSAIPYAKVEEIEVYKS